MNVSGDFSLQMAKMTEQELIQIVNNPADWLPDALNAAKAEILKRGIDINNPIHNDSLYLREKERTRMGLKKVRLEQATTGDIIISIILPIIGLIIGVLALFKGEKKRAFTMISIGGWPIYLVIILELLI